MLIAPKGLHDMHGRRNPFIAQEGVLPMALVAAIGLLLYVYVSPWLALPSAGVLVLFFLLFRDPRRAVRAVALGVVSPVDGEVIAVDRTDDCAIQGEALRIRIRIDMLGAYTARSPVEGKVMNLLAKLQEVGRDCPANAMWLVTDEGHSVVLQFHGHRLGLAPRAFIAIGERLGQGHRCAYLRLSRFAEVYMPVTGRVNVSVGSTVRAGSDLLGMLPHA